MHSTAIIGLLRAGSSYALTSAELSDFLAVPAGDGVIAGYVRANLTLSAKPLPDIAVKAEANFTIPEDADDLDDVRWKFGDTSRAAGDTEETWRLVDAEIDYPAEAKIDEVNAEIGALVEAAPGYGDALRRLAASRLKRQIHGQGLVISELAEHIGQALSVDGSPKQRSKLIAQTTGYPPDLIKKWLRRESLPQGMALVRAHRKLLGLLTRLKPLGEGDEARALRFEEVLAEKEVWSVWTTAQPERPIGRISMPHLTGYDDLKERIGELEGVGP